MRYGALYLMLGAWLVASACWAQTVTVETAMRGLTVVADPTISGAWANNPAGLAALAGIETKEEPLNGWRHSASVTVEASGDTDLVTLNWGGVEVGKDFGLGAGYLDTWAGSEWGVGFGKSWPKKGISWGVNWRNIDPELGNSNNILDAGILGQLPILPITGDTIVKYGVVLRDLTDEFARMWDIGIAFDAPQGVHVAADVQDVGDEFDRIFKIGATKDFGVNNCWKAGVGLCDGNLTLGALYDSGTNWQKGSWKFGAAWLDGDNGMKDSLLIGAFGQWGM